MRGMTIALLVEYLPSCIFHPRASGYKKKDWRQPVSPEAFSDYGLMLARLVTIALRSISDHEVREQGSTLRFYIPIPHRENCTKIIPFMRT